LQQGFSKYYFKWIFAKKFDIPEVYFTHISHQLGKHIDVTSELPQHIQLAYDGLILRL
jgi:phosphoribosyl 1,2-cyclic phosphate phosphodiesterase